MPPVRYSRTVDLADDGGGADQPARGFHNPLFNSVHKEVAPKDARLFPTAEQEQKCSKVSSMVMRRHGRKDGRKDGATVDITRRRSGEQQERFRKAASAKQMKLVSSVDMPACVVVKSGDAADAGEVLQHCAFRMETYKVHDEARPDCTTFLFVFNGGAPSQAALSVTHSLRPNSARGKGMPAFSKRDGTDTGEAQGHVTMTLGGMNVPHVAGEPYSCHIRQVGTVTFNPRKQAKGTYLYILSQEGRTLFTALT